eukprot:COSAG01_NODE_2011_length_8656_cov_4.852402_6_plen_88_part_00
MSACARRRLCRALCVLGGWLQVTASTTTIFLNRWTDTHALAQAIRTCGALQVICSAIGAPCTQCPRHRDPIHQRKGLRRMAAGPIDS